MIISLALIFHPIFIYPQVQILKEKPIWSIIYWNVLTNCSKPESNLWWNFYPISWTNCYYSWWNLQHSMAIFWMWPHQEHLIPFQWLSTNSLGKEIDMKHFDGKIVKWKTALHSTFSWNWNLDLIWQKNVATI